MKITNVQYYHGLNFEEYLRLPGTSFSSLKDSIPATTGMQLGSRVHQYVNEPKEYDWENVNEVKAIATALRAYIGEAFQYLQKEVAFTAEFHHNGMMLIYKGRADMLFVNKIVIDLKVLAGSLPQYIKMFGYDRQISGYCLPPNCPIGLIVAYNKQLKKVETQRIVPDAKYWEFITVQKGVPV